MQEDKIKEAFQKAKQDILNLQKDISSIKSYLRQLKEYIDKQSDRQTDTSTHIPTENSNNSTQNPQNTTTRHINSTQTPFKTHNTTDNLPLKASKTSISPISTGNKGVSTDRQTDEQTDTSTGNKGVKVRFNRENTQKSTKIENLQKISELVNSLDDIKKDLRHKLKKLTNQEMKTLSSIYQLEEEGFTVDYSLISQKLNLTESSIRDYTKRIIHKGIPIIKIKENNKKVILSIAPELRKIASLSTIIQLRDL